ncbi:hypothetical protein CWS01_18145 [Niallia nealsonii]|uniref:Uncharacterized protein n=1 Tax=Niallia nealsonii TaxID=115979 RepID=A0A2N0YY92_9BACI|nr:hypothetical protein CWS01_18145 [Niallia nealsonii]
MNDEKIIGLYWKSNLLRTRVSNEEIKTIKKWLSSAEIKILDLPLKTGLVAELMGKKQAL